MAYNRKTTIFFLLPLILPIGFSLVAGTVVNLLESFGLMTNSPNTKQGFDAWIYLFEDWWVWYSVIKSLLVSIISAIISIVLGTILAWAIYRLSGTMRTIASVYKIPLILPHITVGYVIILLFSQSGFFSSALAKLGFITSTNQFPNLLYGANGFGVGMAYVMKETSFVILMIIGSLQKFEEDIIISAKMLGASRMRIFIDIVLPHVRPAMLTSFLIISLYALGAFEIPRLIGESRPPMLSVLIFNLVFSRDISQRTKAAALLVLLTAFSALLIFFTTKLTTQQIKRRDCSG